MNIAAEAAHCYWGIKEQNKDEELFIEMYLEREQTKNGNNGNKRQQTTKEYIDHEARDRRRQFSVWAIHETRSFILHSFVRYSIFRL